MLNNLDNYNLILASKSPRRKQLLSELGISFVVKTEEVEEVFPENLSVELIPEFLAKLKAKPFEKALGEKDLLITSDTIVCLDNKVMGKPNDYEHAFRMLSKLSGKSHKVITGVCLLSKKKKVTFKSSTEVYFKELSKEEIEYYLINYKPYDKAGAYGIQEWIGHIAVEKINGSYFNVMGLPIQRLYDELCKF